MKQASLNHVKGIGPSTASILSEHGITSVEQLAEAGVEALASIPGFSSLRALAVTSAAAQLLESSSSPSLGPDEEVPKPGKKRKKKGKGKGKRKSEHRKMKKNKNEKKNKKKKKGKKKKK